jgi:hypothetical protein
VTSTGQLLASGGRGGDGSNGIGGHGGGGGSGGVLYLAAPAMRMDGQLRAAGGPGGSLGGVHAGGGGGLGRVRLSVLASECAISGSSVPPLASCAPSSEPGSAYVARYPD